MTTAVEKIESSRLSYGMDHRGVERENGIIRGVIVAEIGDFKTKRGSFNLEGLEKIVELGNSVDNGLVSRWTHPDKKDSLGSHLGWLTNFRMREDKVRADYKFSPLAFKINPPGQTEINCAEYIMTAAEQDPRAAELSLVLKHTLRHRQKDGVKLPPIWNPVELVACDVVGDGDAVKSGLLSSVDLSLETEETELSLTKEDVTKIVKEELSTTVGSTIKESLDAALGPINAALSSMKSDNEAAQKEKLRTSILSKANACKFEKGEELAEQVVEGKLSESEAMEQLFQHSLKSRHFPADEVDQQNIDEAANEFDKQGKKDIAEKLRSGNLSATETEEYLNMLKTEKCKKPNAAQKMEAELRAEFRDQNKVIRIVSDRLTEDEYVKETMLAAEWEAREAKDHELAGQLSSHLGDFKETSALITGNVHTSKV